MTAQLKKGFTLIELLIVIAILGVLAVVVLVAINPVQQLARTRDAGRISGVTQIGHAVEAFYTSRNGTYPTAATWDADLEDSGELTAVPAEITDSTNGATACADNMVNNTWCYSTDTTNAIVYTGLEADTNNSRCAAGSTAFAVYSSADGRGGVVCDADGDLAPGAQTFLP